MPPSELLDRLLEPIGQAFTSESAAKLVSVRADPVVQQRIDELAERCTRGELTSEERDEYESLVTTANVISILQAKARVYLAGHSAR